MTMFPATVLSAQEPNRSSPQSNPRRGKPRSARGNRPNRTSQQDAGTEGSAKNARSKNRRPRGQGQQKSERVGESEDYAITPSVDGSTEPAPLGEIEGKDLAHEQSTEAENAAPLLTLADPLEVESQNSEGGIDASEQPGKKQPKKKGNRAKQTGRNGQPAPQDINQPRHPPSAPSGTPMKQGAATTTATQDPLSQNPHQVPSSNRKPSPMTGPFGSTTTPMKFYAGPTFHMSPAPSSLPVPKFFSKSAPHPDKPIPETSPDTGIKTPNESSEESSGGAPEDSPSMKRSLMVEHAQPREPSPLDIFFKADRQEKAQRSLTTPEGSPSIARAHSSSSIPQASRAHSRHPTGGAIFPMELEGTGLPKTPNERHAESAPPPPMNQEQSVEEKARAKTEALKQLLQMPQKQATNTPGLQPARTPPKAQAPPPGMLHNLRQNARGSSNPDGYRMPPEHSGRFDGLIQAPSGPNNPPQHSPSTSHLPRHPPGQDSPPKAMRKHSGRPASSQLRNEIPANTPMDFSHALASGTPPNGVSPSPFPHPSTGPTPILSKSAASPVNQLGYRPPLTSPQQDRPASSHDDTLRANLARHANISAVSIEDELRRMLNISPQAASAPSS